MPTSLDACPLFIRLFGPLEVRLQGQPLRPLRTRRGEWLLALLALRRDQPVERAWLAGTLWPESDHRQGADSLRRTLTDLRQALGEEGSRILPRPPTPFLFNWPRPRQMSQLSTRRSPAGISRRWRRLPHSTAAPWSKAAMRSG